MDTISTELDGTMILSEVKILHHSLLFQTNGPTPDVGPR